MQLLRSDRAVHDRGDRAANEFDNVMVVMNERIFLQDRAVMRIAEVWLQSQHPFAPRQSNKLVYVLKQLGVSLPAERRAYRSRITGYDQVHLAAIVRLRSLTGASLPLRGFSVFPETAKYLQA